MFNFDQSQIMQLSEFLYYKYLKEDERPWRSDDHLNAKKNPANTYGKYFSLCT